MMTNEQFEIAKNNCANLELKDVDFKQFSLSQRQELFEIYVKNSKYKKMEGTLSYLHYSPIHLDKFHLFMESSDNAIQGEEENEIKEYADIEVVLKIMLEYPWSVKMSHPHIFELLAFQRLEKEKLLEYIEKIFKVSLSYGAGSNQWLREKNIIDGLTLKLNKKELLHLILRTKQEHYFDSINGKMLLYFHDNRIDLSCFDLPFKDIFETTLQYEKIFPNTILENDYAQKYLSNASDLEKENFILTWLLKHFHWRNNLNSFFSEKNIIKALKEFVKLDPLEFIGNLHSFISDFQMSNLFNTEEKLELIKEVLINYPEKADVQSFFTVLKDLDLREKSSYFWNLLEKLRSILEEDRINDNLVKSAKLLKKTLDINTTEIWNDQNKELFIRELEFLLERSTMVQNEQSAFKFMYMIDWLIYTMVLCNFIAVYKTSSPINNLKEINKNLIIDTFKEIRSFANPNMRFKLTKLFLENICNQEDTYDLYINIVKNKNQVALLPTLILISYLPLNCSLEIKQLTEKMLLKINKHQKKYKDGKHMRPLIIGMNSILSQEKTTTLEEKFTLIEKVLDQDFNLHKNNWLLMEAIFMPVIVNHQKFTVYYNSVLKKNVTLNEVFEQICNDVFQVTNQEKLNNYKNTFGTKHNQTALLTYYAKMKSLPNPERTKMLEVLNIYFNSVLENNSENYKKLRYCVDNNPQLKIIFENHPDLACKWKQGYVKDLEEFISNNKLTDIVEKIFDLKSFIINMVMQDHLPKEYCEEFKKYIETEKERKLQITDKLRQEKETCEQQKTLKENLLKRLNSCNLQLELIDAINHDYDVREEQIKKLKKIMKFVATIPGNCEFKENLKQAIKLLSLERSDQSAEYKGWKIIDTDDYWSMFMAGTDVEGSCQRVAGDPNYNKCLMGYVMNGDYRMLAIQNIHGITVARRIIHLLWDEVKKVASLFIEEAYPFYLNHVQEQALIRFAIYRAKDLGLNLVSVKGRDPDPLDYYNNKLIRIKGGIADYVYSDANNQVIENYQITISNAKFLYNRDRELYLDKKQELYEEALKCGANIYQKGLFFSASKHATLKQPYGPYSDHLCYPNDPLTSLTLEFSKISLII